MGVFLLTVGIICRANNLIKKSFKLRIKTNKIPRATRCPQGQNQGTERPSLGLAALRHHLKF